MIIHHHHDHHHADMVSDFKIRFWISLVVTIPVLALSPLIQSFFGYSLAFPADKYVLLALSSFIYFYGGWPFLTGLVSEFRNKRPGMMTLVGLAITIAYVYSAVVVFGVPGKVFFWELVTLIDVMLLGHWIEMRSVMSASNALQELVKLLPSRAHRISDSEAIVDVKIGALQPNDRILVKPGEKIPVDGQIIEGESDINEAMVTGESKPVNKKVGDQVIGGSVNGEATIKIKVTKIGKDSYLSQVIELVKHASESKSRAQGLADKAAFWLTITAISVGIITLSIWLVAGRTFVFSLERMVTVMVITCPHALGLAIPLVIAIITTLSAKRGLLIRNRTQFENARNLDVIVLDKTGTLTKGEFGVSNIITVRDWNQDELLAKAASIEQESEHTIAQGIVNAAKEKQLKLLSVKSFKAIPGKGAKATIDNAEIYVGNKHILEINEIDDKKILRMSDKLAEQGKTAIFVIANGKVQGIIALEDIIREESKQAIEQLKKLNLKVAMITGDKQETARYVAQKLELDEYFAEVLPDKKSEKIKELQQQGKKVAMVGDGINDAPALAQADVGIAIGAGTDVAIESADVVLVQSNPLNVVDIILLSKITRRKTKQNLFWAVGYNVFAIPLAAGVLYKYGILMPPAVGAIIMSISTIIVAINARLISY
jgi:Cu2+-exporting ATPase